MNKLNYLRLISIVILTLGVHTLIFAQSRNDKGEQTFGIGVPGIFDRITEQELIGVDYKLINITADSVVSSGKAIREVNKNGRKFESSSFRIKNVPLNGTYKLNLSYPGYEECEVEIDGRDLASHQYVVFIDNIFMDRKARDLDEIAVNVSKVKFYYRGDTIVYNADAFVMAEGSMLDDILRQLPGVELKENGQIYSNGERVESLLLNGKDFFKGNHEMMLKNLAAYTVKNIEVYERQKDIDKILGKDYGKKELTMDVKLKKEYHHNFMGNVEGGYGTENRYLGRLFGMWNSDHARISLIGNVNNLNEVRKPGMDYTFSPDNVRAGTLKTYMGGVEYNVENKKSGWELDGDAVVKNTALSEGMRTYTTNFLPSGDTYLRQLSSNYRRDLKISTTHTFKSMGRWHYVEIHPSVQYSRSRDTDSSEKAVFNSDVQNVTSEFINTIFDGTHEAVAKDLLNRELWKSLDKSHDLNAKLWSNGRFRLKTGMLQSISYLVSGSYLRKNYDLFDRFGINFGNNPVFARESDRYIANHPDYEYNLKAAVGYQAYPMQGIGFDIYYEYSHTYGNATSSLYNLDHLSGVSSSNVIGYLPSYHEYMTTFDAALSYLDSRYSDIHTLSPNVQWRINKIALRAKADVCVERQHIDYTRMHIRHLLSRTKFHPGNMELEVRFPINRTGKYKGNLVYSLTPGSPNLINMIDIEDHRDPMNILIGNPELSNSAIHRFEGRIYGGNDRGAIQQGYGVRANIYQDMLAAVYDYNTTTGVKTTWMQNVKGNWDINATQQLHVGFGSNRHFYFDNETRLTYISSVDFLSENGGGDMRNKVNIYAAAVEVKIGYNKSGSRGEVFFKGSLQKYCSAMTGFRDFMAGDFNYGIRGVIKLPANFQITTDFTIYSRRGYNDELLNTNNFLWNARVSYSIPKAGVVLKVDGFDILHNLSNVTYAINAQARTEKYYTSLPRYFLFHLEWKFNTTPKK